MQVSPAWREIRRGMKLALRLVLTPARCLAKSSRSSPSVRSSSYVWACTHQSRIHLAEKWQVPGHVFVRDRPFARMISNQLQWVFLSGKSLKISFFFQRVQCLGHMYLGWVIFTRLAVARFSRDPLLIIHAATEDAIYKMVFFAIAFFNICISETETGHTSSCRHVQSEKRVRPSLPARITTLFCFPRKQVKQVKQDFFRDCSRPTHGLAPAFPDSTGTGVGLRDIRYAYHEESHPSCFAWTCFVGMQC
jgi:hypothetical protein